MTEWTLPRSIRRDQRAHRDPRRADEAGQGRSEIKVAERMRGLNNGLTNERGMLEGLVKGGILAKKEAQEKELDGLDRRGPGRGRRSTATSCRRSHALQAERRRRGSATPSLDGLWHGSPLCARPRRSTGCRWSGRSRTSSATPASRSATGADPRGPGAHAADLSTPPPTARCSATPGRGVALPKDQRIAAIDKAGRLRRRDAEAEAANEDRRLSRQALRGDEARRTRRRPARALRQVHRRARRRRRTR